MELFLIRHAQSENNALPEKQRVEDPGLTTLGARQARHLGHCSPQWRLTRLYTSPFLRALQTTEPIHTNTGLAPEVRVELHEVGGCMHGTHADVMRGRPGMAADEISRQFPEYKVHRVGSEGWWQSQPYETQDLARRRARQLLQDTCREFAGSSERVAYVMHADFKRLFLEQIAEQPLDYPFNASVTRLDLEDGRLRIADYNRTTHMPEDLLSF